jgi:sorting nexin-8
VADTGFVEKRRRGLARFANALVRHPILSQDQLVIMFLTVPTVSLTVSFSKLVANKPQELSVWRKQASITIQDEFTSKTLPVHLEDSLSPNLPELFDRVRTGVRRASEQYIALCTSMERMLRRNDGLAAEFLRISTSLVSLVAVSSDAYAADNGDADTSSINNGVAAAGRHYENARALAVDEARAWEEGVLEDLKRCRDGMVGVRDMFERRERNEKDGIPALERRIMVSEEKLRVVRGKPEGLIKPGEIEKIEDAIIKVRFLLLTTCD